jgi:hypothetical protein
LAVLKWFVVRRRHSAPTPFHRVSSSSQSTLKDQYTSRNEEMGSEKKYVPCRSSESHR